jgi:CRISPR-associated protein Csh1
MIEGVRQIGAVIRGSLGGSRRAFLEELTAELPRRGKAARGDEDDASPGGDVVNHVTADLEQVDGGRRRKQAAKMADARPQLIVISIDTAQSKLDVDSGYELDVRKAREILWIGNVKANDDQDRFVTDTLPYLLSQTVPNVAHSRASPDDLAQDLSALFPSFYRDFGTEAPPRWRYALDLGRFGIDIDWTALEQIPVKKSKDRCYELAKLLLARKGVSTKGPILFALRLNGTLLSDHPGYHAYLLQKLVGQYFDDALSGVCHLCGQSAPTTMKLKELRFKAYITDKVNFATGTQESGFWKNYRLCQACYESLLLGERFVDNYLRQTLLRTRSYIIPELSRPERVGPTILRRAADDTIKRIEGLKRIGAVPEFGSTIDWEQEFYQLTLIMVDAPPASSRWKILELIPEVPPSRIEQVTRAISAAQSWADQLFGLRALGWLNGIEDLPFLLPVTKGREGWGVRPALSMAKHIILGDALSLRALVSDFVRVARARHFADQSFVASDDEEIYVLRTLAFIEFLRQLKLVHRPQGGATNIMVSQTYADVMDKLRLDTPRQALFMLGVVLARVASEQYKASRPSGSAGGGGSDGEGDRRSSRGTKPVLEKVNYRGMPLVRVRQFSLDVFDKLRQYRRLADSELDWVEAKLLLDSAASHGHWPLTDQENVYYLLSGYAYETRMILTSGTSKEGREQRGASN